MLLDTDVPLGNLGTSAAGFRDTVSSIAKHVKDRSKEKQWAHHLRFLTPSLIGDAVSQVPMSHGFDGSTSSLGTLDDADTDRSASEACTCSEYVARHFDADDRNLRATEPTDVPECCHFVAASYCWESAASASYSGDSYEVEVEGRKRSPNCSPALLERVILFTSFYRCSFIWIDQECINQYDLSDKQTGIQAMDFVYQRASWSVAVLEASIAEQRHIDALEMLLEAVPAEITREQLIDLIELLELIMADPWFERAWTLQESTSGSHQMRLMVRYDPTLTVSDSMYLSDDNLELELSQLHNVLSSWLPMQLDYCENCPSAIKSRANTLTHSWFEKMVPDVDNDFNVDVRTACNGAEAIAYLSGRKNSVVSDRLAILANLCQYDVRLDTLALDQAGYGFSICALTLSVLNGDMSMLTGLTDILEGKWGKQGALQSEEKGHQGHGFSWCMPNNLSLGCGVFLDKETDVLRIKVESLSTHGLGVRGCLWLSDRIIDMAPVRRRLLNEWSQGVVIEAVEAQRFNPYEKDMARVRAFKVAMATELLCHLDEQRFTPLAQQLWSYLRLRPTTRQLEESQEVRNYANASLEAIIDVSTRTLKWPNPIPLIWGDRSGPRKDPFQSLASSLPQFLVTKIIEDGQLTVARPMQLEAKPANYTGIFETAQLGDHFLSPQSNFGNETPRMTYSWYPMTWKVEKYHAPDYQDRQTLYCKGLVAGNWKVDELHMRAVYLR